MTYSSYSSCEEAAADFALGAEAAADFALGAEASTWEDSSDAGPRALHPETSYRLPVQSPDYCSHCTCSDSDQYNWLDSDAGAPGAAAAKGSSADASSSTDDYSGTNNQVEGADEGDIVKTDGEFIFILPAYELQLDPARGDSEELFGTGVIARVYPFDQAAPISATDLRPYRIRPTEMLLDGDNLPTEMLLDGDNLVIIGASSGTLRSSASAGQESDERYLQTAVIQVWNVANKAAPVEVEGSAVTSRLVARVAYVVVQTSPQMIWMYRRSGTRGAQETHEAPDAAHQGAPAVEKKGAPGVEAKGAPGTGGSRRSSVAPGSDVDRKISFGVPLWRSLTSAQATTDAARGVPMARICNCNSLTKVENLGTPNGFVSVIAIHTSPEKLGEISTATHVGRGYNVMMSLSNIYIAQTNWNYMTTQTPGGLPTEGVWTAVLKFAMNAGTPTFATLLTVPGSILNQFSMDESSGNFRIATTYGEMWADPPTSTSGVYIFDPSGERIGEVTGLAKGERIYSVRFQGDMGYVVTFRQEDMGYVVTFRQVDPLFVLDLSDPKKPVVKGQLKIPGFSEYLHPVNRTHLLGLGKETVDNNGRVTTKGVKVSLFDVTDPTKPKEVSTKVVKVSLFDVTDPTKPKEAQVIVIGQSGSYSIAATEHKAFLYHPSTGLLAFPIQEWEQYEKTSGASSDRIVFDGCLVYNITSAGMESLGRISHMPPSVTAARWASDEWWRWDNLASPYRITRPIYMAGHLLTLSARTLAVHRVAANVPEVKSFNYSLPVCGSA
ncbi:beta propeller domain-containing protein [Baffinella frigidus]|nr:beta propeller domain-containing protein [Cryptophyta sp. CCMP2293]